MKRWRNPQEAHFGGVGDAWWGPFLKVKIEKVFKNLVLTVYTEGTTV